MKISNNDKCRYEFINIASSIEDKQSKAVTIQLQIMSMVDMTGNTAIQDVTKIEVIKLLDKFDGIVKSIDDLTSQLMDNALDNIKNFDSDEVNTITKYFSTSIEVAFPFKAFSRITRDLVNNVKEEGSDGN